MPSKSKSTAPAAAEEPKTKRKPRAAEKAEPQPRAARKHKAIGQYWRARGLYSFIRGVLGPRVSDNEIARRWGIDPRVFNDIKYGRVAVPRIDRLSKLAPVLGVNEHFIYSVAAGAPWRRILAAARRGEFEGALQALAGSARKAEDTLRDTQLRLVNDRAHLAQVKSQLSLRNAELRALLEQLHVGVLGIDDSGRVVSANSTARTLFGLPRNFEGPLTLALDATVFIALTGAPFDATKLPIYQALRRRRTVAGTFTIHRRGQPPRIVVATASPIREGRRLVGVISVLREVSDLFEVRLAPGHTSPPGGRRR